jgi:hypothetical protein
MTVPLKNVARVPAGTSVVLRARGTPLRRHARPIAVVALVVLGAAGAGLGAFATFFASSTAPAAIGSGEVAVEWAPSGGAGIEFDIAPIYPGQSVERLVELRNTGSLPAADLQLTITAADSNESDGIQLMISDCSVPWSGTTTFSCAGVESVVSPDRPARAVIDLPALGADEAGGGDYLRVVFRVPASAPAALQAASATIGFEVLADTGGGRYR